MQPKFPKLKFMGLFVISYFAYFGHSHFWSFYQTLIIILTHLKCQFNYSKKSFQIYFISCNIILISNLTISNIFIQILIFILIYSKWSIHFIYFIWKGENTKQARGIIIN